MKIIIEKQFNEVGDEYMEDSQVEARVWLNDNKDLLVEVDGNLYKIPNEIFTGIFK